MQMISVVTACEYTECFCCTAPLAACLCADPPAAAHEVDGISLSVVVWFGVAAAAVHDPPSRHLLFQHAQGPVVAREEAQG
jgi:hypothetical protein